MNDERIEYTKLPNDEDAPTRWSVLRIRTPKDGRRRRKIETAASCLTEEAANVALRLLRS